MKSPEQLSWLTAFLAGFLSFVSPCVFPLIPSYLSYITGISFNDLRTAPQQVRWATFVHSLFFILGFTVIFVLLGLSFSTLGQFLLHHQQLFRKLSGLFIIFFGVYLTGVLNALPFLRFLQMEKRLTFKQGATSYAGSFLVGVAFAMAWTPCIGPILGAILLYAATTQTAFQGGMLLFIYSLGLGIPFLFASLAFNSFLATFHAVKRYLGAIEIVSGIFLILVGILVYQDYFAWLSLQLNQLFPGLNF